MCNKFLLAKTDKKKYNKKVNFTKFSSYYITKWKPNTKTRRHSRNARKSLDQNDTVKLKCKKDVV